MNLNRIKYLFSNSRYSNRERELYRAVITAAGVAAQKVATKFECSLTDPAVTFSIGTILKQLPVTFETPAPAGQYEVDEVIDAIDTLRGESYLDSDDIHDYKNIQLASDLFKYIAEGWAEQKYSIEKYNAHGYRVYAVSQERANEIALIQKAFWEGEVIAA